MSATHGIGRPDETAASLWRDAKIVVVDDEQVNLRLLESILSRAGYTDISTTVDPAGFVADYERTRPDLVLLDLMMPGQDGIAVLRRIRALSPPSEFVPVLMLTADTGDDAMRRALSAGVDDFLTKPFDTVEVQLRIANLLRTRRLSLEVNAYQGLLELEVQRRTQELQLFRDVLEAVPDPVVIEHPDRATVVFTNKALNDATGRGVQDETSWANGHLADLAPDVVRGDRASTVVEDVLRLQDGTERAVEILVQAVNRGDDRLVAGIARDVTDRVERRQALRRSLDHERQAAEEHARVAALKDAFLRAVSHEIRTPLSVVSGVAGLLLQRRHELDSTMTSELLKRLVTNTQRLEGMLLDLLDLNNLVAGDVELRTETFRIDVVLSSRVADILGHRPREVVGDPFEIEADRCKLVRAIDAVLTNIAKHTPPSTPVKVVLDTTDPVRIRIADRGPGIPDELKDTVFDPFVHGPTTMAAHSPGTGIGLALARTLLKAHGGDLAVEDTPGGGATFTLQIPRRPPT